MARLKLVDGNLTLDDFPGMESPYGAPLPSEMAAARATEQIASAPQVAAESFSSPAPAPTREDLYSMLAKKAAAVQMPQGLDLAGLEAAQRADARIEPWRETGDFVTSVMLNRPQTYRPRNEAVAAYLAKRAAARADMDDQLAGIQRAGDLEAKRRADENADLQRQLAERKEKDAAARLADKDAAEAERWGKEFGLKERQAKADAAHKRALEALEREKLAAESGKADKTAARDLAKATADLRKEFQGEQTYKDTQALSSAFRKVNAASDNPAGDLGLIYGYMRLLDPGSSVKEGEFALAANSGSFGEKIQNAFRKVASGDRLTPAQRSEFKAEAAKLWGAQRAQLDPLARRYEGLAQKAGVAPEDVVLPLGDPSQRADDGGDINLADEETKVIGGQTFVRRGGKWARRID